MNDRLPEQGLPRQIAAAAEDLPPFDDEAFGALFDRYGDRRVVLLGEASHGTSEFYQARAAITKRLIEKHGFTVVAVEADWPDAAAVNRAVQGMAQRDGEEMPFSRFPTWMWRNTDVAAFLRWLRTHNDALSDRSQAAGFYGLDLYNMRDAIAAVLAYLDEVDPEAAAVARERYGCLTPWQRHPEAYGRAVLSSGYSKCEAAVVQQCRDLLERRLQYAGGGEDAFLDAAQSARLVTAAEHYYRAMYYADADTWNLRDQHMFDTLRQVLEAKGPDAKAVVWAHNSHIGDARHTEMGQHRGELNIGQLCREHFGDQAALIGFGTHTGTVAAATDWGDEMEIKRVRPSHDDSVERWFHQAGKPRFLLDLKRDLELAQALAQPRLERFIGVIYRPQTELMSHYAEVSLSRQFDAYLWFDETSAVTPLAPAEQTGRVPDTYPFGL
jgi:erythromycin esterase-like protein